MMSFEMLVQFTSAGFMNSTVRAFKVPFILMLLNTVFSCLEHTFRLGCRFAHLVVIDVAGLVWFRVRYGIRIGRILSLSSVDWLSFCSIRPMKTLVWWQ